MTTVNRGNPCSIFKLPTGLRSYHGGGVGKAEKEKKGCDQMDVSNNGCGGHRGEEGKLNGSTDRTINPGSVEVVKFNTLGAAICTFTWNNLGQKSVQDFAV